MTQHLVRRERLVATIQQAIPDHRLVLVAAPAGYGKTTLLAQWAHTTSVPVVWLSIDEDDNDGDRLLRYLFRGWEAIEPEIGESPLGLLLGAIAPDREAVLTAFVNAGIARSGHLAFVLDDVHLIGNPSILQALTFLLNYSPPTLHFVLGSRGDGPLRLAQYRARDELLELRANDMAFTEDETNAFLHRLRGSELAREDVESLHAQLEGWPAGLHLVGLTVDRDRHRLPPLPVTGRHRFIADYLSESVVTDLPGELRQFLLRTSILDDLCEPLCDAVTGMVGSQATLDALERASLFLMPLDDNREWFRYHRLFADYLRAELHRHDPDGVADLHRRAARWYLTNDLPEPAFDHAIAGDDRDLVIRIGDDYVSPKLHGGEFNVVERWLASIPETWYASYPALGLLDVAFLALTGSIEACVQRLDGVERELASATSADMRGQRAKVTAFRCFIACFQNDLGAAESSAEQALRDLPEQNLSYRADVNHALGETYGRNGRWAEARTCLLDALTFTRETDNRVHAAHVFGAIADLELRRGRLRDADAFWRKALTVIQDRETWGRLPLPVIGWVYVRIGELLYERDDLASAWDYLARGLERAELGGDVRAMIAGYVISGRVKLAEGDIDAAAGYLERARPLVETAPFPEWSIRWERLQLEVWLAQGRHEETVDWADRMMHDGTTADRVDHELARLAVARVLVRKGDPPSVDQALSLLSGLVQDSETSGRLGITIEALAMRALAGRGDPGGSLVALERALGLAEPDGYVRLFADLGLPMARLLQDARSRGVRTGYVTTLLAAFGGDAGSPSPRIAGLPEPLSHREQDVLRLIAAGLTNREIADSLFVSPETVKKHTSSIYGKLGVPGRTAAVARARALDVLD